uniref:Uncharacterized protein n=1 Tax=Oryza punctata TaxID=4537 RepID=A0A0E0LBR7_ORYPU
MDQGLRCLSWRRLELRFLGFWDPCAAGAGSPRRWVWVEWSWVAGGARKFIARCLLLERGGGFLPESYFFLLRGTRVQEPIRGLINQVSVVAKGPLSVAFFDLLGCGEQSGAD